MSETPNTTPSGDADDHDGVSTALYLKVWAGLAILTAVEYFYAYAFQALFVILLAGLLLLAAWKAGLVGWFFMHLKFEGLWVYILIIPACVLAAILVCALLPDVTFKPETEENPEAEAAITAPAGTVPVLRLSQMRSTDSARDPEICRAFAARA
jgi:cytochrome c oxidase subunit 4